jgi:hypothetical protein
LRTRLFTARFGRTAAALAVVSALAVLVGAGQALASPGTTSPARSHAARGLYLRHVKVRLSAAEKAQLAASGVTNFSAGSEIINEETSGGGAPYCLDAEASGPLAGESGDPVQIWHCNGTGNQLWYAGASDQYGYQTLVNAEWPSECLNINSNGGVQPGSLAQLWSCSVNTANEYWDVSNWEQAVSSGSGYYYLVLVIGYPYNDLCLDAINSYPGQIKDGDLVQVWSANENTDEFWGY